MLGFDLGQARVQLLASCFPRRAIEGVADHVGGIFGVSHHAIEHRDRFGDCALNSGTHIGRPLDEVLQDGLRSVSTGGGQAVEVQAEGGQVAGHGVESCRPDRVCRHHAIGKGAGIQPG
ncbi:hypothetical protein D9M71_776630 [compost metagenome]